MKYFKQLSKHLDCDIFINTQGTIFACTNGSCFTLGSTANTLHELMDALHEMDRRRGA